MYLLLVCGDICHWLCGDQRKTRVCVCVCMRVLSFTFMCFQGFSPSCQAVGIDLLTYWDTSSTGPKTLTFKLVLIPPSDNVLVLFINFKLYLFILGQGLSVPSHSPSFAPPVPSCSAISRRDPRQTARVHTFLMGQPHLSHLHDQISTHCFHFRSIFSLVYLLWVQLSQLSRLALNPLAPAVSLLGSIWEPQCPAFTHQF